ncbi:MAG: hypothetical protein CL933_13100 [Deltaproteobacteria bacterium]|nr:hypothetical protein [Deltaproteobacteria bacterium]
MIGRRRPGARSSREGPGLDEGPDFLEAPGAFRDQRLPEAQVEEDVYVRRKRNIFTGDLGGLRTAWIDDPDLAAVGFDFAQTLSRVGHLQQAPFRDDRVGADDDEVADPIEVGEGKPQTSRAAANLLLQSWVEDAYILFEPTLFMKPCAKIGWSRPKSAAVPTSIPMEFAPERPIRLRVRIGARRSGRRYDASLPPRKGRRTSR